MKQFNRRQEDEQKKPYLDRIHSHPKVKKLYITNEIITGIQWLVSISIFFGLIMQLMGIDTGAGSIDLTAIYVSLLMSKTGLVLIGILVVSIFAYKMISKVLKAKLNMLEDEVYYEILRSDSNASESDNSEKDTPKVSKFIFFKAFKGVQMLSAFVMLGLLFYTVWPYLSSVIGNNTSDYDDDFIGIPTLATPSDVSYDDQTSMLSWNAVEHAGGYEINYNNNIYYTTDPQLAIVLASTMNAFKVRAVANEGDAIYDSEWSFPIVHKEDENTLSVYDKVNIRLNQVAAEKNYQILSIIGISYASVERGEIEIATVSRSTRNTDNKTYNTIYRFEYPGATSISEILNDFDNATFKGATSTVNSELIDYNSAEYFIKGLELGNDTEYKGQIKQYVDQGYSITVLQSCTLKSRTSASSKNMSFYFMATFKAVKGNDVKYFTSEIKISIPNKSVDDDYNYEVFVGGGTDYRNAYEQTFILHDEETMPYMSYWIAAYDKAE